jgi:hypothetical protein
MGRSDPPGSPGSPYMGTDVLTSSLRGRVTAGGGAALPPWGWYVEHIPRATVYDVARVTALSEMPRLSERLGHGNLILAKVCGAQLSPSPLARAGGAVKRAAVVQREDTQREVFSFKLRGAYNFMAALPPDLAGPRPRPRGARAAARHGHEGRPARCLSAAELRLNSAGAAAREGRGDGLGRQPRAGRGALRPGARHARRGALPPPPPPAPATTLCSSTGAVDEQRAMTTARAAQVFMPARTPRIKVGPFVRTKTLLLH